MSLESCNPLACILYIYDVTNDAIMLSSEFDSDCSQNNKTENRFARGIRRKQDTDVKTESCPPGRA